MTTDWLQELRIGDEVFKQIGVSRTKIPVTVTQVSKTLIYCDEDAFSRETGAHTKGSFYGQLCPATWRAKAQRNYKRNVASLRAEVQHKLGLASLGQLRRMLSILDERAEVSKRKFAYLEDA